MSTALALTSDPASASPGTSPLAADGFQLLTWGMIVAFVLLAVTVVLVSVLAPALSSNSYLGRVRRSRSTSVHGAVTGWKVAHVVLDSAECLRFAGISHSEPYRPDSDAVCAHRAHHAPARSCTCGFYAFRDRAEAENIWCAPLVLLEVALSGQFVEYEKGFRTAHQRVESVLLAGGCCCGGSPVAAELVDLYAPPGLTGLTPRPRCRTCVRDAVRAGRGHLLRSCEELSAALLRELPAGRTGVVSIQGDPLSTDALERLRTPLTQRAAVLARAQLTTALRRVLSTQRASRDQRAQGGVR